MVKKEKRSFLSGVSSFLQYENKNLSQIWSLQSPSSSNQKVPPVYFRKW